MIKVTSSITTPVSSSISRAEDCININIAGTSDMKVFKSLLERCSDIFVSDKPFENDKADKMVLDILGVLPEDL